MVFLRISLTDPIYGLSVRFRLESYSLSNSALRGSSGLSRPSSRMISRLRSSFRCGTSDLDGDDLVAALAGMLRALDAALAHAQLLPALRAGRNLQLRAAVDGGHFDLGAERGFGHGDRDGDLNVVALRA